MKRNKGFTLVELIVVIAIVAIIMLIGVPAFAAITKRIQVRSDRASAQQIGKAVNIAEVDGQAKDIPSFNAEEGEKVIKYNEISGINTYVSTDLKPQSSKTGYYFATRIPTSTGLKTVIGISAGTGEAERIDRVYDGKSSGLAYIEGMEIGKFIELAKTDEIAKDIIGSEITLPGETQEEPEEIWPGWNRTTFAENSGMYAVNWDGDSWEPLGEGEEWDYSYGADKKWANAKSEDGSMWVWIPRYMYDITSGEGTNIMGTIAVQFLEGTALPTTADIDTGYTMHPAFKFGSRDLTGIWVAKY